MTTSLAQTAEREGAGEGEEGEHEGGGGEGEHEGAEAGTWDRNMKLHYSTSKLKFDSDIF